MSSLLILGGGGHGKVVAEAALSTGIYKSLAFLDDKFIDSKSKVYILGCPLIGNLDSVFKGYIKREFATAIVAIGDSYKRLEWINELINFGYQVPPIIHSKALVSPSAHIGNGSVLFANSCLQTNSKIGKGVILNTSSIVEHDNCLGDGVHVGPGAMLGGEINVGENTWIGIGSSIKHQIKIGNDVTLGAGAVLINDLPNGVTAVGVPAKIICTN